MLAKLLRWLKRWWSQWFGVKTPQQKEIAPPPKNIDRVFWGLVVQAKTGATGEQIQTALNLSGISDGELTIWLRQYGGGLTEEEISSEWVEGLQLLARLDIGAVSREALGLLGEWEDQYKPAPLVSNSPQTPSVTSDRRNESQTVLNVEVSPDIRLEAEALLKQGGNLYNAGDIQGALSCWEQAIKIQPHDHFAYNNRGIALSDMGRYEEAIADHTRAIELEPNFYVAYYSRANALAQMGRYEEAIADHARAIEIEPNFYVAYYRRANTLAQMGKYENAIADYNAALGMKIDFWEAYANRGGAIFNAHGYEAAITSWDEGLNHLDPTKEPFGCATLHQQQGNVHYQYGKRLAIASPFFDRAVESYQAALALLPDDLKYRETTLKIIQDLISVYRTLGDAENAEKWELKVSNP